VSYRQRAGKAREKRAMESNMSNASSLWNWKRWSGVVVLVIAAGVAQAEMKQATIVVDKPSKSKGEVVFALTPQAGEEQQVTITVVENMSPPDVAAAIAKEFDFKFSETFKVSHSGGKVTVKPLDKKATFDLKIANQTVQGIAITIK
jgi:hypothetical protein